MADVALIDYGTREQWLAARAKSIGASESAAMFGLAPPGRETPYSLWARKSGLYLPTNDYNEAMEWGHLHEPLIADVYQRRTQHRLWAPPSPYCVAVHPKLPFLTATIDRWIIYAPEYPGQGELEIKNVSAFAQDWRKDDVIQVPLYVQVQVQHQLAVTGFRWASVAALIGGNRLEIIPVERNDEFIEALEDKAADFWRRVERGDPPPLDGYEASTKAVKSRHPDDNGESIELTTTAADLWQELQQAKEAEEKAKLRADQAENRLRDLIGPNTYGVLPDGRRLTLFTTVKPGYTRTVGPQKYRSLRLEKVRPRKRK